MYVPLQTRMLPPKRSLQAKNKAPQIYNGGRNKHKQKIRANFTTRRQLSTDYEFKKKPRQAYLNLENDLVKVELN